MSPFQNVETLDGRQGKPATAPASLRVIIVGNFERPGDVSMIRPLSDQARVGVHDASGRGNHPKPLNPATRVSPRPHGSRVHGLRSCRSPPRRNRGRVKCRRRRDLRISLMVDAVRARRLKDEVVFANDLITFDRLVVVAGALQRRHCAAIATKMLLAIIVMKTRRHFPGIGITDAQHRSLGIWKARRDLSMR